MNRIPVEIGEDPIHVAASPFIHPVDDIDQIGNEEPAQSYRINWANVSNTPFREYKHFVHEGGIATPMIIVMPDAQTGRLGFFN